MLENKLRCNTHAIENMKFMGIPKPFCVNDFEISMNCTVFVKEFQLLITKLHLFFSFILTNFGNSIFD